ncbi:MAG: phage scaffolding protein [Bacteroidales bacterium]|nr:phage scaffolding protein [Bacteroidales bacterium]
MTKESLMQMGLTDEQATKVMEALNGAFVPKSRFNEVNTELQNAKNTIKERDTQLEELKKSTGDVKALNDKITELQTANAEQKKAHDAEMKALKISNAVEMALTTAKAKNNVAAKALLSEFLTKAELAEDGTVKGLDAEIKKLVDGESTAFLFDKPTGNQIKGAKPAEKSDVPPSGTGADLSKMTYD